MSSQHFYVGDPLSQTLPFLPDLAELEWRIAQAFHARLLPAFDPAPLGAWTAEDWQHALLRFQPGVAVVCSPWPIREIWAARHTPLEQIDIDVQNRPDHVLVHRRNFDVRCDSVSAAEAEALSAFFARQTLGSVTERLAEAGVDPAPSRPITGASSASSRS